MKQAQGSSFGAGSHLTRSSHSRAQPASPGRPRPGGGRSRGVSNADMSYSFACPRMERRMV